MIELQDAIERAKLAADDSGYINSYTYDQLIDQLQTEDQYAFTMALVDLGIHTKLASKAYSEISDVIYEDCEDEFDRKVDIVEEFVKSAQQYVQSPGGLWVPDTYQDQQDQQEEQTQDPEYESFLEETPFVYPDQSQIQQTVEPEFVPSETDTTQLINILEQSGMSIDQNGNVTLYQQNVPGLYTEKIPLKPMPIEKAIDRVNSEANSIDKEQSRIESLQDILSSLNTDFQEIEMTSQDLLEKFDESFNNLEQFRYSERSTDENIRSIAEGLSSVRQYLEQVAPTLDDFRSGLGQHAGTIADLQGRLDTYFQMQYEMYDQKLDLINALSELKNLKDNNPQEFQNVIQGVGGVSASMFIQAFEEAHQPEYGSLEVEVGFYWLKDLFESVEPGRGDYHAERFIAEGGFNTDDDLKDSLAEHYDLDVPEDFYNDIDVNFNYVSGSDVEAEKGMWYYEDPDPDVGIRGGWVIEDMIPVNDIDFLKNELSETVNFFYEGSD